MSTPTFSDSFSGFRAVVGELIGEWRRELALFAGETIMGPLARGNEYVRIDVEAEEVRVNLVEGGTVQEIGRVPGTDESRAREISSLLAASELVPRGATDVAVQLSAGDVLRRRFELPAASRATLARAVPFELERLSPIEADKLYYDFIVLDSPRTKKQAELELRIVKRSTVDTATALAHAAGLKVGAIRLAGDSREADWRSFPVDRSAWLRLKWQQWNVLALAAGACLLAMAVVVAAYLRGAAETDALSAEVDAASDRAAVVHRLSHDIEDVRTQIEFPLAQKQAPMLISILSEVTRVLPDGTWLTEFALDGNKGHIQGFSKSASDVVGQIDRSSMFANAQFMAPLQSAQNGMERFDLSFDIKGRH